MCESGARRMKIHPSILSADFANLEAELYRVRDADAIHVDVMDNHFVPNLTLGAPVVSRINEVSTVPLDVHLMITDVDSWALHYAQLAAPDASITFHIEASQNPVRTARQIRQAGGRVGIALRPATPVEPHLGLLGEIDLLLLMTVEPGFGGQPFLKDVLPKICQARAAIDRHARQSGREPVDLQVDGGVSQETLVAAAQAGAHVFVAGSAIFRAGDPAKNVAALRHAAQRSDYELD